MVTCRNPHSIQQNFRANHARLVALKDRYDPGNLFLNTTVKPSNKPG